MDIHRLNRHVLSTECVPDTILREVFWDGDRPVYLSSQASKINKIIAVCQHGGRLSQGVAILNSVATKKVTLMYLEGERRTTAFQSN